MTSPIADGVMAATYKLVQQAMTGQWQDVPKTIEERRVLLDQLSASATAQDQQWLSALKQAMAESDAAVAKMTDAPTLTLPRVAGEGTASRRAESVDGMLDMIRGSR
jgi:recombinational DNA repair ATPase RecF